MKLRACFRLVPLVVAVAVAVPGCSRSAQSYVERGDAQLKQGNADAAVLEYRNAVGKDPKFAPARVKLAEAYQRQGNLAGALAESVRAADLLPGDAEAQLKAGALLFAAGRHEDAKARAEKAIAINPKNADALTLRANAMAGLRDLDGAIAQIRQAIAFDPSADRQSNLGIMLHAKGLVVEAESAFRQAIASDPKSINAQIALAKFLSGTNRPAEAETAFKAALAGDPSNGVANAALADFYMMSNRAAEVEPYLKKLADTSKDPLTALALADYYVRVKRNADAMAVLDKLSATPRVWAVARTKVAAILYADGRNAEAHKAIDEVIAKSPGYSEARVVRAGFLMAEGKSDEALAEAQQAAKSEPRNVDAHFLIASIQKAKGEMAAATASFNEVLRLDPNAAAAQLQLAGLALQRGEFGTATQLAEQALQRIPGNLEARLILARGLLARGEFDRATAVTREALDAYPKSGAVHAQAGLLAMRKGDRTGARTAFEEALTLDPTLLEPLRALVALDVGERQMARARARIEARLQKTPKDGAILVLAARTWAATGDQMKAEEFLHRAVDANAANFEAYGLLAQLYISQRKLDQALAEYDKLAARQPGAVGPQTMAGLILEAQGKQDEARVRYERVLDAAPKAALAANNLAWIYASRGEQLDRALQLAQTAKAELPDNAAVSDTLAFVYIKKQLGSLSVPLLKEAIAKEPGNPSFHYHLGLAYSQTGDKASARYALEQALKLKPDFDGAVDARTLLATLH